jgi:hypothetical protein
LESLVKEIVHVILKNADTGAVKTRWNACHALAHLIKIPHFPLGMTSYTPSIITSLTNAIRTCKNFKVRIAAASALGEFQSQKQFGMNKTEQQFALTSTIVAVKEALNSIDDLVDRVRRLPEGLQCQHRCGTHGKWPV